MVNFSILDSIGNGNDNPIPIPLEEFKANNKKPQAAPSNNKSNHELTAAVQPKVQPEIKYQFSIYGSIGLS
jgi:hypothetical protein